MKSLVIAAAGLVFAILWASAAAATKIGLAVAQPFVIALARFALASALMLVIAHVFMRQPLPRGGRIWQQLAIYGLLNVSLYLGLYVVAMQDVSAGLGSLFIATNPVLILLIQALWYRRPIGWPTVISFGLCISGMLLAAYPLFGASYATPWGIGLLFVSMGCYSIAAVYFAQRDWDGLHILTINGWQTLIGGLGLLPTMLLVYDGQANAYNAQFWTSVAWLAIPVSIVAVLLWLYLLRDNAVNASAWLFLCPIAGFAIASILMDEPLSGYTYAGVALVLAGLYLVQRIKAAQVRR